MPHAILKIEIDDIEGDAHGHKLAKLEMNGCRTCLLAAITDLFEKNKSFKALVNEAGKEANRRRAVKEN